MPFWSQNNAPKEKVTIPVETDVFDRHPDAAFYVGVVAAQGNVFEPELYDAASRLRYEVYVKEKGLMRSTWWNKLRRRETDRDDRRSIHFAVVQNGGDEGPHQLVGTSRLIVKDSMRKPLPVERLYPEAFTDGQIAVRGVEASRFIARNGSVRSQHNIARGLIRAMSMWMNLGYRQPVHAVVDRQLAGMFRADGVPYTELSEPRVLEEYSTPRYNLANQAVAINSDQLVATMIGPNSPNGARELYTGVYVHQGLGYFDKGMRMLGHASLVEAVS